MNITERSKILAPHHQSEEMETLYLSGLWTDFDETKVQNAVISYLL